MPDKQQATTRQQGLIWATGAYSIWGFLPLYWKLLAGLPAFVVLCHRTFWAACLGLLVCTVNRPLRAALKKALDPRILPLISLSTCFVGCNWFLYIWAVNSGHVIETSLGYFMNPLLNVFVGTLFLKEKLRPAQWSAIAIAFTGVIIMIGFYGTFPWISIALATSFALYGVLKNRTPGSPLANLTIESLVLSIILMPVLFWFSSGDTSISFMNQSPATMALLVFSGFFTACPLFCFGKAAQLLPLSILGFMQYLAPTLQLCIGIWVFKEDFGSQDMLAFGFIWLALLVFSVDGLLRLRLRSSSSQASL